MKALKDKKYNVAQIMKSLIENKENIVGKGPNVAYQQLLLFPQYCHITAFVNFLLHNNDWRETF